MTINDKGMGTDLYIVSSPSKPAMPGYLRESSCMSKKCFGVQASLAGDAEPV